MSCPDRNHATRFHRHGISIKVSLLSAVALSALIIEPARSATIVVNNQSQFDAAITVATQPGHTDTIDATAAGTIDAGTLTLPAGATSIDLQFSNLAIGASGTGDQTVTLGAGTTVSFEQIAPGELDMGFGNTGTLNINGGSLIFNVTNQGSQFNIGLDGGNGIVNMTAGAVTINDSGATPGVFGSISIGYPFGATAAQGTFNQSGGVVSVSEGALNVGIANGTGTYNLSGTAVLQDRGATVYIGAAAAGVGIMNISGNATLDFESVSAGANGQLYVGDALGVGTITQNGANSTVILNVINIAQFGSNASAGPGLGGTGTYNLIAGTLEIGGLGAAFGMDPGGIGIFNQSGGSLTANAPIYIGMSGNGTYNISGGSATLTSGLTIADLSGSVGGVNQTGGTLTISAGALTIGGAGTATYSLNGGVLQVGGASGIVGSGPLNFGGGTLQVIGSALTTTVAIGLAGTNSTVDTNSLGATFGGVMSGTGGFAKSGLGTLNLAGANTYSGGTTLSGGLLQVDVATVGVPGAVTSSAIGTGTLTFNGGALQAGGAGYAIANAGTIGPAGGTIDSNGNRFTYSGDLISTATPAGALTIASSAGTGTVVLSGVNTYSGSTLVSSGFLEAGSTTGFSSNSAFKVGSGGTVILNGNSSTIASLADGTGGGTVQNGAVSAATLTLDAASGTTTFSGTLADNGTGPLGLTKTAASTQILTGTSSYTGGTTIAAGTLQLGNGSATGTIVGNVIDNGVLAIDRSNNYVFAGLISGTGAFEQIGGGVTTLTGGNTYSGGTILASGVLQVTNATVGGGSTIDSSIGTGVLTFDGGALRVAIAAGDLNFANAAAINATGGTIDTNGTLLTYAGIIADGAGGGILTKSGAGTLILSGGNSYSGGTAVAMGTVQVTNDQSVGTGTVTLAGGTFQAGANGLSFANGFALDIGGGTIDTQAARLTLSGAIGGTAALNKIGTGTVILTGTSNYTGGTTIAAGTLQLGNGGTTGAIVGNVTDNGVLAFDRSNSDVFAGAITGAGAVRQIGGGTVVLTGTSLYTGITTIANGTLQVDGALGNTAVTVGSGAVLDGTGRIAGTVTVAAGGTLAPGDGAGKITLGGLTLDAGSLLSYQLGKANVVGGSTNDRVVVTGALTIHGGTLNVTNSGGFGLGAYRLFDYGTLAGNGRIAIGTLPNGETGVIQTAIPGQINLIVNGPGTLVQFWDGATTTGDGTIHGGSGTWNATATDWTSPNGRINASWQGGFGVFAAAAGTVTVAGPIAYQGLQFSTDGYVLTASGGGTLAPAGLAEIRVDAGMTATIAAPIVGSGGVQKTDPGTLILSGRNTYTGGTSVAPGVLRVTNDRSVGSGAVTLAGGTFQAGANGLRFANGFALGAGGGTIDTQADRLTLTGAIGGAAALTKIGTGTLVLTGASTYSGGSTIANGRLQLGNGGTTGAIVGTVTDNGVLAFDRSDSDTFAGAISGTGAVRQIGTGTVILTGTSNYTGGTTIAAGTLQLGNGGTTGATVGNVTDNGVLAFDRSNSDVFAGAITGAGAVRQIGGGTVVLTGTSLYTGVTTIANGTLQVDGALGNTAVTVGSGAVLDGTGRIAGTVTVAAGGTLAPGDGAGKITLGGLTLDAGSLLSYQLGKANVVGGSTNDRAVVTGALTIHGGTLNVTNSGGFGLGAYRLFDYGTLAGNGRIAIGTLPHGESGVIQTAIPGQINLIVNGPGTLVQFWDGATTTGDGTIHGGSGTWNATATDWTSPNGRINASWQGGFGVFAAAAGTVTVAGPIAYQGLQFSTDGYVLTASGGGTLAPAGLAEIRVDTGMTATIAAPIVGSGGVQKTDPGTLILSGRNTYTGGTSVAPGVLRVTNDRSVGSGAVTLAGGTFQAGANGLRFANGFALGAGGGTIDTQADRLTLTGALGGAAALTKIGRGTLVLTGTSSYAGGTNVAAGTLAVGADTALGTGALILHRDTTLAFAATGISLANAIRFPDADPTIDTGAHSDTISGDISGVGGLTKTGGGTLTLTGTDSYTGATSVVDGTLQVDGSLDNSTVSVARGATLSGSGAVGRLTISAGATVAPGSAASYSRLSIAHGVGFAAGSSYQVGVNASGATDSIVAGGRVTLSGGTVMVRAAPGAYAPATSYTILSAAGGVSGTFAGATTDLAFLTPTLTYDPDDVFLTLTRGAASFASVGATPNQRAVAPAAEALGVGNLVFDTILSLTAPQARGAFDALSGEIHGSAVSGAFEDSRLPRQAIFDRLDSAYGALAPAASSVAPGDIGFWGQAFGSSGQVGGNGNAATLDRSLDGFIVGADASPDPRYRIGVVAGYTDSRLTVDRRASSGSIETFLAGLYGGAEIGKIRLRVGAIYAANDYHLDRTIASPGFSAATRSGYHGHTAQAFAEAGYNIDLGRATIEPFVGAMAMQIHTDDFTERGAAAALTATSRSYGFGAITLGVKGAIPLSDTIPLVLKGTLGWHHVFGDVTPNAHLAFASAPQTPFTVQGAPIARDSLAAESGLVWAASANTSVGLFYSGDIASGTYDNVIKGKIEIRF